MAVLTFILLKCSVVWVHVTIGAVLKLQSSETDFLGNLRLMALLASHLLMLAGERVSRLGVIEILGSLGVLPVVYVVAFLTVRAKLAFVVVLMTGHALGRGAEKGFCRVLPFQKPADLRQHVSRSVAFLASNTAVLPFQGIARKPMVELLLRWLPVDEAKILSVVLQVAANAILAVGILHLQPRVVSEVF